MAKKPSEARKARRESSWRRGQDRKAARSRSQAAREAANRKRRASSEPTPWETACAARRERRTLAGRKAVKS
jgi:hypothetical protein